MKQPAAGSEQPAASSWQLLSAQSERVQSSEATDTETETDVRSGASTSEPFEPLEYITQVRVAQKWANMRHRTCGPKMVAHAERERTGWRAARAPVARAH